MSATRDKLLQYLVYGHGFVLEHPFRGLNGKRRFRFDAALPERMVSVDYHGWGSGAGHMARAKQAGDHEKVNEAQLCGWTYIICDAVSVDNGKCFAFVDRAIETGPELSGPVNDGEDSSVSGCVPRPSCRRA